MKLFISDEVRSLCPSAALGMLSYRVHVAASSPEMLARFDGTTAELQTAYTLEAIAKNPHIATTREAYRALGKFPHEYRNAAEAMLRRVVKGTGLYHINNVVELNNLISVSSGYSIGSYDVSGLNGDIELCRAPEGAHYGGIGKESVNIGFLPVLYDTLGPFGNPSSDSSRAMITPGDKEVLSILNTFDGVDGLAPWLTRYAEELRTFCCVSAVKMETV